MKLKINAVAIGLLVLLLGGCQPSDQDSAMIDAARAGYTAFQQGDMEAWAATQASDVEWIAPQSLPYAGTYYGPQAVMENVFTPILELWPDFEVEVLDYKASGNTVFIFTRIHAGGNVSESLHVATIENGKYVKFQVYDDGGYMMQSALTLPKRALTNTDHVSAEWQIAAYSSAAPAYIGDFATVIGGNGEVLRKGSNGWTCLSLNPRQFPLSGWRDAHDAMPGCGDAEGMKWMQAALAGTKPLLERDTFIWMLHGDVGEDNTKMGVLSEAEATPGQWIESGPHLMLMPKEPATLEKFGADFTTGEPYVMMPGSDYAHLMIPLVGYYDWQQDSSPSSQ